jgi:hypothetical protein
LTPYPKVCKECDRIYAGDSDTERCLKCDKNYKESRFINRLANAEALLEILAMQSDTNPEWASKKAKEHLKEYRG